MADHVLHHNIRVDHANTSPYPFTTSTFGSHHIGLVDTCGWLWNSLLDPANQGQRRPPADLSPVPVLRPAPSEESFGLVKANLDVKSYHSLVVVKEEPDESLMNLSEEDPEEADQIMRSLGLDPSLLHKPLEQDCGMAAGETRTPSGRSSIAFVPPTTSAPETMDVKVSSLPNQPSQLPTIPVHLPRLSYLDSN